MNAGTIEKKNCTLCKHLQILCWMNNQTAAVMVEIKRIEFTENNQEKAEHRFC